MPKPLAGSYGATLAIVLLALSPFIVATTATTLLNTPIEQAVGIGPTGISVVAALATAGYAFGALAGGSLTQRFPQRILFIVCESLFVVGAGITAGAWEPVSLGAGRALAGLATGLLLVVAIPPLVQQFGPEKLAVTAGAINIGFFGAVTVGPLLGGVAATGASHWRWFYAALAVLGLCGLVLGLFSLPQQPPPNPDAPPDWSAYPLGIVATFAPFAAVGLLEGYGFGSAIFASTLAIGGAALVALLLTEYHKEEPISPVKPMSHSLPVLGIVVASLGGAVYVTLLELAERYLLAVAGDGTVSTGLAVWPQVAAIVVTAGVFYLLVERRSAYLPVFVLFGLLLLAAAAWLLTNLGTHSSPRTIVLWSALLLGVGAGATVSPALWLAGWSMPVMLVGRVFALIELLRAEADYLIAPVLNHVATPASHSATLAHGIRHAVWLTLWIGLGTIVLCLVLWFGGGVRLRKPNLEQYLEGEEPGLESPPLLARLRAQES